MMAGIRFEFATAGRIIFGSGALAEVGGIAAQLGRSALVLRSGSAARAAPLLAALADRLPFAEFVVRSEPTTGIVRDAVAQATAAGCDVIIGMGGGSVLDCGKAVAALLANGGDPLDYLEVIGRGQPLDKPSLPFIAIPTTSGTGAEVTRNAVLSSPEHRVKVSLRSPRLLPRVALVDPLLTYGMPPRLTASTGLDALTQLIEPFVSVRANPMADTFCREGMVRVSRSLRLACREGSNATAREEMALASLLGGMALANSGLGAVHGFASVLGGMYEAPHGAVCAALLPHVMQANVKALQTREPQSPSLRRYHEVACLVVGDPGAAIEDGIGWVTGLCTELGILPLRAYGLTTADFRDVVEKTTVASSTKANPIALTTTELTHVLERAL